MQWLRQACSGSVVCSARAPQHGNDALGKPCNGPCFRIYHGARHCRVVSLDAVLEFSKVVEAANELVWHGHSR